jgi:hypothetical protein
LVPTVDGAIICALAEAAAATNINVAASIDLMGNLGVIDLPGIEHICLVGNSSAMVQGRQPIPQRMIGTMPDNQDLTRPC